MLSLTRPVTAAIEAEVLCELRQRGIVIWLDRDGHYSAYVDEAAARYDRGEFPHPVVGFRGSFLELMLALEGIESGLDPTPVLIHMPGFTEDSVRRTPVLELYTAGFRYRRALETAVREAATGKLPPDDVEDFVANEALTLRGADRWLSSRTAGESGGFEGLLESTGIEVAIRELLIKDTFLSGAFDAGSLKDLGELRAFLARQVGIDDAWFAFVRPKTTGDPPLGDIRDGLAAWLLCVEYVDDLRRAPYLEALKPLSGLPKKLVELCREQVEILRAQHPREYERLADHAEGLLEGELPRIRPEDLGRIDTFRSEEAAILEAAVEALSRNEWGRALQWVEERSGARSFWLGRDQRRRMVWGLVAGAAKLGCALAERAQPMAGVTSFDEALDRYVTGAFKVDLCHRTFEQRCLSRLQPQLPHFVRLKEAVAGLRVQYREWADGMALDFSSLCRSIGLLPDPSIQQRFFFEQEVLPLTRTGKRTAVFLVDALRYELAVELAEEIRGGGAAVQLTARFAELPTVTAVGMNALAPVSRDGRLRLVGTAGFRGFATGEFAVDGPEKRARAMGLAASGERALSLSLREICEADPEKLRKQVAQKQLIVVHSREIDEAGEAGVGLAVFEQAVAQVVAAYRHLRAAGVDQCVISSDHGFLLQDETTATRTYGKATDANRRYVYATDRRKEDGLLTVSLSELGLEGREGFLLFPDDTTVFLNAGPGQSFVHGGNSPQERIVPVLSIAAERPSNLDLGAYCVEAEASDDACGYRRLRVRVLHDAEASAALPFPRSDPVELAVRAVGRPDIRVAVVDVIGPAQGKRGRIQAPIDEQWSEVFFSLEGPADERVRIEVFHPDRIERVRECEVTGWYQVQAVLGRKTATSASEERDEGAAQSIHWSSALPDDGIRQVFEHINEHGVITEPEAVRMLGTPRAFRRFSNRFDELCALTPLRVYVEVAPEGKRYVREGRKV